jgi:hypothetical protein
LRPRSGRSRRHRPSRQPPGLALVIDCDCLLERERCARQRQPIARRSRCWREYGTLKVSVKLGALRQSVIRVSKGPVTERVQYGDLPYRVSNCSRAEFVLVTSRDMRRWIIPKRQLAPSIGCARN